MGPGWDVQADGGFGGGGASYTNQLHRPGAGGGYSGGQGDLVYNDRSGGAGGSYYNTSLVSDFTVGNQYSGHGKVIVTYDPSYTP